MSTLHYRPVRGDMLETYQILSGKYDTTVVPHLKTMGIQATRFKYDIRKFYFTNRVVDAWNSLSQVAFNEKKTMSIAQLYNVEKNIHETVCQTGLL